MSADRAAVSRALVAIEAEMRRIGVWDETPITDEQLRNGGAFGTGSVSFTQWLRWVFVPRVGEIQAVNASLPTSSSVGAQAAREWGFSPIDADTSRLETLLSEFDALFD
jgi:uncharacterized protein YqcC (DUF446 family)